MGTILTFPDLETYNNFDEFLADIERNLTVSRVRVTLDSMSNPLAGKFFSNLANLQNLKQLKLHVTRCPDEVLGMVLRGIHSHPTFQDLEVDVQIAGTTYTKEAISEQLSGGLPALDAAAGNPPDGAAGSPPDVAEITGSLGHFSLSSFGEAATYAAHTAAAWTPSYLAGMAANAREAAATLNPFKGCMAPPKKPKPD